MSKYLVDGFYPTKRGSQLVKEDQQRVLNMFVNRFTKDHKPGWANQPMPNGQPYPVQFASDEDWLEHTFFEVTAQGRLNPRATHCESHPTWPDNPELSCQLGNG